MHVGNNFRGCLRRPHNSTRSHTDCLNCPRIQLHMSAVSEVTRRPLLCRPENAAAPKIARARSTIQYGFHWSVGVATLLLIQVLSCVTYLYPPFKRRISISVVYNNIALTFWSSTRRLRSFCSGLILRQALRRLSLPLGSFVQPSNLSRSPLNAIVFALRLHSGCIRTFLADSLRK